MDYLDPKKKRAHKIRLSIGYGLFAVAIGLATLILVFLANGYYIDRQTGEVIQNGLVFVDSKPQSARLFLDGEETTTTDARLVIPAGDHTIRLERDGYRSWQRSISLEGGSLRRITYPRLIPNSLDTLSDLTVESLPSQTVQSPDKRWVATVASDAKSIRVIDLNLPALALQSVALPELLVPDPETLTAVEIIEWSDDNETLLISLTTTEDDVVTYGLVSINPANEAQARNLSAEMGSEYDFVLRDRQNNSFFAYDRAEKLLYTATTQVSARPLISQRLIDHKVFGADWVLYVTSDDTSDDLSLVQARLRRGDQDILLRELPRSDTESYLLEIAKLGRIPVIGVGEMSEGKVTIYNDPERYLAENESARIPVATTVLRVPDVMDVTISSDSSVIMAYGPNVLASHEFEADRSYRINPTAPVTNVLSVRWMDGQHVTYSSNGTQHVVDFDGSNLYDLVATDPTLGLFFDNAVERMFSFTTTEGASQINEISLLAPADR